MTKTESIKSLRYARECIYNCPLSKTWRDLVIRELNKGLSYLEGRHYRCRNCGQNFKNPRVRTEHEIIQHQKKRRAK